MKLLEKYLDDFEIHGRLLPAVAAMLPLIMYCFVKGILYEGIQEKVCYSILLLVFGYLSSKSIRICGKKAEKKLYNRLGGKPTTIILRFSDNRIDTVTKKRYHKILNRWISGLNLPLTPEEETLDSDEEYKAATTSLINCANDHREKEPRVYQELKEYNFWRNLYGIKWYVAVLYLLLAIRELYLIPVFSLKEMIKEPIPEYLPFIIMAIGFIIVAFFVRKGIVEERAFDYAKALVESCERVEAHEI